MLFGMVPLFCATVALVAATDAPALPIGGQPQSDSATNSQQILTNTTESHEQDWNWHAQNTDILDYHPGFRAKYSGPNSLNSASEVQETVSLDLLASRRLWQGAEFHLDGLMWQGFGFSKTVGVEGLQRQLGRGRGEWVGEHRCVGIGVDDVFVDVAVRRTVCG